MGQPWATQEEYREGEEGKKAPDAGSRYAFAGQVIRLDQRDLDRWRTTFHAIPDITGELTSIDAWLCGKGKANKANWFHVVARLLNTKHQEALASKARIAADPDYMPL
jgi:hypothetical protein